MVAHVYNPSTQEAKAEGSQVQGQIELHSETLTQQTKKREFKLCKIKHLH
jgi:hypothetical protein